jgi:hypothetical protein
MGCLIYLKLQQTQTEKKVAQIKKKLGKAKSSITSTNTITT